MNKDRHIIGEIQELFANNEASKAVAQHKDEAYTWRQGDVPLLYRWG